MTREGGQGWGGVGEVGSRRARGTCSMGPSCPKTAEGLEGETIAEAAALALEEPRRTVMPFAIAVRARSATRPWGNSESREGVLFACEGMASAECRGFLSYCWGLVSGVAVGTRGGNGASWEEERRGRETHVGGGALLHEERGHPGDRHGFAEGGRGAAGVQQEVHRVDGVAVVRALSAVGFPSSTGGRGGSGGVSVGEAPRG